MAWGLMPWPSRPLFESQYNNTLLYLLYLPLTIILFTKLPALLLYQCASEKVKIVYFHFLRIEFKVFFGIFIR